MSIFSPQSLPTTDRLGNPILTNYKNMIRAEQLIRDVDIDEQYKLSALLLLLYDSVSDMPKDKTGSIDYVQAVDEFNYYYSCGGKTDKTSKEQTQSYFRFSDDASAIVADYMAIYNIDLTTSNMHWWRFVALFEGLPNESNMNERIMYRGANLSKIKDKEQRAHYKKMKEYYKLEPIKQRKLTPEQRKRLLLDELHARHKEIETGAKT